jgi:hypothetical protein
MRLRHPIRRSPRRRSPRRRPAPGAGRLRQMQPQQPTAVRSYDCGSGPPGIPAGDAGTTGGPQRPRHPQRTHHPQRTQNPRRTQNLQTTHHPRKTGRPETFGHLWRAPRLRHRPRTASRPESWAGWRRGPGREFPERGWIRAGQTPGASPPGHPPRRVGPRPEHPGGPKQSRTSIFSLLMTHARKRAARASPRRYAPRPAALSVRRRAKSIGASSARAVPRGSGPWPP